MCFFVFLCVFMCFYVFFCVFMCFYVFLCVFMCFYVLKKREQKNEKKTIFLILKSTHWKKKTLKNARKCVFLCFDIFLFFTQKSGKAHYLTNLIYIQAVARPCTSRAGLAPVRKCKRTENAGRMIVVAYAH